MVRRWSMGVVVPVIVVAIAVASGTQAWNAPRPTEPAIQATLSLEPLSLEVRALDGRLVVNFRI